MPIIFSEDSFYFVSLSNDKRGMRILTTLTLFGEVLWQQHDEVSQEVHMWLLRDVCCLRPTRRQVILRRTSYDSSAGEKPFVTVMITFVVIFKSVFLAR